MEPTDAAVDAADPIAARLDRLPVTPLHRAIVTLCALGLMFDVIEAALSNALSAVFSSPPHQVAAYQLALLLASVFAGGAVGAPLLGWFADRRGRRMALGTCLLALAVTSVLAAASTDIGWLTCFRVVSGMALGAYPPLMVAYLADVLPPARRGMLILAVGAIGFLGAPAVVFLIRWLTPLQPLGLEGWRCALLLGAVGAAGVGMAFRSLPESPRWLAAAGRDAEAAAVCDRFLRAAGVPPTGAVVSPCLAARVQEFSGRANWFSTARRYRARTVVLCALYFLSPWATIGFPLLSGAVLIEKGFRVANSLLYLGVAMLGPSIGVLAGAAFIDRIERRTTLALCAGAMAVIGLLFASSELPAFLMATGIAFNLVGSIYIGALSIYGAELFPTALRATASAGAWAVNRVASALVPLALLPLLKTAGVVPMFALIALALAASTALILAFGQRGLSGRPVS